MADENYEIAVHVTPGASVSTAQRIAAELGRAETQGGRTGAAISRGMRESGLAAERAQASIDRFLAGTSRGSQAAGRAVDGLTAALRREQQMLDRISGGRHQRDLQTLDALFTKNKISVRQYTDEVVRLNRELERGRGLPAPGGAPRGVAQSGGGGMLARLGGAGKLAAGAGIAFGLNEIKNLAGTYQDLQNKMRVVAAEGESVSVTFDRVRGLATDTRSSLESTTIAYQRLKGATKEMGLGTDDLLRVTERINKAIKVSGASAEEAKGGMIQLAQGIASGRLGGEELRSVLENLPYVADILAESMGVTRGKLRDLGAQGKLTSEVVVGAFEKMGAKIDKDFGKTVPTMNEQLAMLKDQVMVTVGQIATSLKIFDSLGRSLGNVASIVGVVGDAMKGLGELADFVTGGVGDGGGIGGKLVEYASNPFALIKDAAGLARDGVQELGDAMTEHERGVQRVAKAYLAQVAAMERLLAEEAKLERTAATLDKARAAGIAVPAFDLGAAKAELQRAEVFRSVFGTQVPAAFSEATKKAKELDAALEKMTQKDALKKVADEAERTYRALKKGDDILQQQEDRRIGTLDDLRAYQAALGKLQATRALVPGSPISRTEVEVARGLRDLELKAQVSEGRFGVIAEEEEMRRRERMRAIEDNKGALEAGILTYDRYIARLREAGIEESRATKILKEMRQPALDWSATISALNALLRAGRIDLQEYNTELQKLAAANPTRSGVLPRGAGLVGGRKIGGQEFAIGFEALTPEQNQRANERGRASSLSDLGVDTTINVEATEALIEKERELFGVLGELAQQTELLGGAYTQQADATGDALAKLRANATDTASALESLFTGAFSNIESGIGDMLIASTQGFDSFAESAKASVKNLVESAMRDLTRLIIRQAIAGLLPGGGGISPDLFTRDTTLMTIPGFAAGGEGVIGGSGPPDSKLFMARVSPGEHFQFTPPGQAPPPAAASTAPPQVTIVNVYDDSQIEQWMEKQGESYTLNTLRRNQPAVRGRSTGR